MAANEPLVILHLSDLHFGPHSRFAGLDFKELGKRFYKAVEGELRSEKVKAGVNLVLVTGDIAEAGLPREYGYAKDFFEGLAGELGVERQRFVFMPGNHDVCWARAREAETEQQYQEFDDRELRRRIDEYKFQFFNEFISAFYGSVVGSQNVTLERGASVYNFEDLRVSVGTLNSCEKESHRSEDHIGLISEEQVQSLMNYWGSSEHQSWIKIATLHHNPVATIPANIDSWKQFARQKGQLTAEAVERFAADAVGLEGREHLRRLAEEREVQLLLHGHHHATEQQGWNWRDAKGQTHILSAGSWGVTDDQLPGSEPNAFRMILLDVAKNELRSHVLAYEPRARTEGVVALGNFVPDPVNPKPYRQRLDLPKGFKSQPSARRKSSNKVKDSTSFLVEYRRRLGALYNRWDLSPVGVTQSGGAGKPIEANLDEMYLPLRLGEGYEPQNQKKGQILSPEEVLGRTKPLVIRGIAGAGKTTWMRWTFRRLLDQGGALPIMLELRRLAHLWQNSNTKGAERALDTYLEDWVSDKVGGGWRGYLPQLLKSRTGPRPILLVDGWDELGELGEELRAKLVGFMQSYPRLLAVVSSRPYGQGRPSHSEGFEILDIQPLSDEEITNFTKQFYEKCYAEDQRSVEEAREQFTDALNRSPDATALARTALLLTMMLLISRSRPLPDKRHQLYHACIENLLTALPDRKQREGAQLLQEQWRPDDSEERLRVVSRMAALMQEEGYKGKQRAPIVQSWDALAEHLPERWGARRKTFLAWLAGPAGLLVDRADGTLSFTHLSFQEYLVAWHLQATVEGDEKRKQVCDARMQSDNWWETLRLWAALVEGRNPAQLKPVLSSLLEDEARGMWLGGAMLADGLGGPAEFDEWAALVAQVLKKGWVLGVETCGQAWAASRQNDRRTAMGCVIDGHAPDCNWMQWQRYTRWFAVAGLGREPKLPREGTNARVLVESLKDYYHTERHVAVGRVYSLGSPLWPGDSWELLALQTWPSRRRTISLKLQALASLPVERTELLRLFISNLRGGHRRVTNTRAQEDMLEGMIREHRFSMPEMRDWSAEQGAYDFARIWRIGDKLRGADYVYPVASMVSSLIYYLLNPRPGGARPKAKADDIASYWAGGSARIYPAPEFAGETIFSNEVAGSGEVEIRTLGFDSPRAFLAYMRQESDDLILGLFAIASRLSLHPEDATADLERFIASNAQGMDPLWPALARHIARLSTAEDRLLLEDLARHPEQREPPLSWALKYYVRGDVVMNDGTVVTLNELSEEAGVKPLPYLEQMREEPQLPRALLGRFRGR